MIGRILILILGCAMVSCAEPKYLTNSNGGGDGRGKVEDSGLRWPHSGHTIWLQWEVRPTESEFGSFLLKIGRPNAADQSPVVQEIEGDVAVVLWMPSMGHGSSPVRVEKVDIGTYRATRVFFTMPGDWEIRIQRKSDGNIIEQAILPIRI